ncbi:MAG: ArnT family glycosyltransferase [Alphaproteobacteria bacterium]
MIFLQGVFDLPVMDRDEARFATASKTMLHTKDFIDIRMVDEPRYKKPVGIYWLQTFSNYIFGSSPYSEIWVYRMPSILGIFSCLILVFIKIKSTLNERIACMTVFFLTLSLLTISEAHQAKTDGVLFLFTTICNLLVFDAIKNKTIKNSKIYLFWTSLALGILIKGPIIILFTLIPLLVFSLIKKDNYFRLFWSIKAFSLFLIISIPWFIIINIKSGGIFWDESVGNDLFNKIKSGQESHGFPPGYYSLLILVFFWPGSIFLVSIIKNIKSRFKFIKESDNLMLYLIICFISPFLLFEIIPTKLPHYIYPTYVPLSILISKYLSDNNFRTENNFFGIITLLLYPIVIISLISYVVIEYSKIDLYYFIIIICLLIFSYILWSSFQSKNLKKILFFSGSFQIFTYLTLVFFLIPRLEKLWVSEKLNDIIMHYEKKVDVVFTLGFNEPSLLFLTSYNTKNPPNRRVEQHDSDQKIVLIVSKEFDNVKDEEKFSNFSLIDNFTGFNYSKGKEVEFRIYKN